MTHLLHEFNKTSRLDSVELSGAMIIDQILAPSLFDLGEQHAAYEELFWRPYLGSAAFDLYRAVSSFAQFQCYGVVVVDGGLLSGFIGRQNRAALGRALVVLDAEGVVEWSRSGNGRKTRYELHYLRRLPVLTLAQQSEGLNGRMAATHELMLGCVKGFDLPAWRRVGLASLVPFAVERFGRGEVV